MFLFYWQKENEELCTSCRQGIGSGSDDSILVDCGHSYHHTCLCISLAMRYNKAPNFARCPICELDWSRATHNGAHINVEDLWQEGRERMRQIMSGLPAEEPAGYLLPSPPPEERAGQEEHPAIKVEDDNAQSRMQRPNDSQSRDHRNDQQSRDHHRNDPRSRIHEPEAEDQGEGEGCDSGDGENIAEGEDEAEGGDEGEGDSRDGEDIAEGEDEAEGGDAGEGDSRDGEDIAEGENEVEGGDEGEGDEGEQQNEEEQEEEEEEDNYDPAHCPGCDDSQHRIGYVRCDLCPRCFKGPTGLKIHKTKMH
jgi:hypothetical protein